MWCQCIPPVLIWSSLWLLCPMTPNFVRPQFGDSMAIKQGRHPILDTMPVETGRGGKQRIGRTLKPAPHPDRTQHEWQVYLPAADHAADHTSPARLLHSNRVCLLPDSWPYFLSRVQQRLYRDQLVHLHDRDADPVKCGAFFPGHHRRASPWQAILLPWREEHSLLCEEYHNNDVILSRFPYPGVRDNLPWSDMLTMM